MALSLLGFLALMVYFLRIQTPLLMAFGFSSIILGITCMVLARDIISMTRRDLLSLPIMLLVMAAAFIAIDIVLTSLGAYEIGIFFSVLAMSYLMIVYIYLGINKRASFSLNLVSAFVVMGFVLVLIYRTIQILK
jgi:hypothetical protein